MSLDAKMDEFGHTATRQDTFGQLTRQKSSKLQTVPCGFFLISGQNYLRLDQSYWEQRP